MKRSSGLRRRTRSAALVASAALALFLGLPRAAHAEQEAHARSAGARVSDSHAKGATPARSAKKRAAAKAEAQGEEDAKAPHHPSAKDRARAEREADGDRPKGERDSRDDKSTHEIKKGDHGHGRTRRGKTAHRTEVGDREACHHGAVSFARGSGEDEQLTLTRCDGKPAEHALEKFSLLLRPNSITKPAKLPPLDALASSAKEWVPGVKPADAGLLSRLQAIGDHYHGKKITLVSGYRPGSVGSYHKDARAVDIHVEGVRNEDLASFCRGMADTGCGYYPNSSFVHFDVRPRGTGHVYWIDASGPGEAPRYVASWPPSKNEPAVEVSRPDHAAPADEHTHPDAGSKRVGHGVGASDRDDESPMDPKSER